MYLKEYKTLSHEYLISFLKGFYKEFSEYELNFIDKLRILRNKISYEGFLVESDYYINKKKDIKNIIEKLKTTVNNELR